MQAGGREALRSALDSIMSAKPPRLFAERYQLLPTRVEGSQGLVQFAQADHHFYAIKCGCSHALDVVVLRPCASRCLC